MQNKAKYIDHTILKADAKKADVQKLCDEAKQYGFASVCVNPCWVPFCAEVLKGSEVKVCTVIGFPLGANTPQTKAFEAADAIKNGAAEVDMVINIGALKDGLDEQVYQDILAVRRAAPNAILKVIIETCLLTDEEKVRACQASAKAKADFVKTSTGFSTGGSGPAGGATEADVKLMKANITEGMQVKASGGVRDVEAFNKMLAAGATRIGTSSGIKIITGN